MPAVLNNTTLSAAVTKESKTIPLTSVTNVAVEDLIVLNGEIIKVTGLIGTAAAEGIRGYAGTHARAHASGAIVFSGPEDRFSNKVPTGTYVAADVPYFPHVVIAGGSARAFRGLNDSWVEIALQRLANFRATDPDTGYEYILVDCQSAFVVGEWVVITGDGAASQLATDSKGRVGIITETVSASDTLAWAVVVGTYASALFTSGVTTACVLKAAAGHADISNSAGGNVIFNATCSVAPSTATSPTVGDGVGTAVLSNPYVYGVTTDIVP